MLTSATMMMFGQAQSIANDNYNSLTAGNVGTDVTGATVGQGGYYIGNGTPADFQIVVIDAAHGNSLRLTSGNGAPPATGTNTNNRFAFKNISTTATASNNILSGALEFYTGPATGAGKIQFALYDATNGIVGINYDYATKKISGMGRLTPVPTATVPSPTAAFYNIGIGTSTFAANTWVSVSFTYNKTTGAYTWTTPEGAFSFSNAAYTFTTGMTPTEFDVVSLTLAGNTIANQAAVDNVNLQYTNAATLGIKDVKTVGNVGIAISPNPTSDILNIKTDSKINAISVIDFTGRKVNVKLDGDKVDVRSLPAGTYLINIETKDGISTEKFIKK
ncbi:T9SS type A sorting domain-containing protein [Chryseobacterium luquanense]|uniref:T9SS type A sorting domain-containing protein n=1 Tax=Chryseobacterium luquanense TaxID=2983766 RepID=A0ABT3Y2E5_9FLAO|nr:T9SS type A sorting domain-containing protein [Chryseobacterium luquanense]MCX8532315.1 T9SS type A sorting domain-containing protein [Chryseobacterium luquanense]